MAQTHTQNSVPRPRNPMTMLIDACKADDVSLMEQAITLASQPKSRHAARAVIQQGLRRSAARGAVNVLHYVLDHGADVRALTASEISATIETPKPSQRVLEILVANGWDINTQGVHHTSWPLLWMVTEYQDLVVWCLDNGASVDIPEDQPKVNADGSVSRLRRPRPTILGMAATNGSVETFELLRAQDAPLDPRTLHLAVEHATILSPKEGSDHRGPSFARRMDMVRHLVDVVQLDVNAVAHEVGSICSLPLCYPASRPTAQDFRELVDFLLARGADPRLGDGLDAASDAAWSPSPIACAERCHNERFLQIVQEWENSHQLGDVTIQR